MDDITEFEQEFMEIRRENNKKLLEAFLDHLKQTCGVPTDAMDGTVDTFLDNRYQEESHGG